jgi:ribonuclease III
MSQRRRPDAAALEAAIGHVFADGAILAQALTHVSAVSSSLGRTASYQRLEFLGDRVLGLVVADMLFRAFPDDPEGALAQRLSELVRKETCALVAEEWGIGSHLRLGTGEGQSGGRKRMTILGDACEAVIGGVFLDAGFDAARSVVAAAWSGRLDAVSRPPRDAKTTLQEWAQARGLRTPAYRIASRSGPDHRPSFVVEVAVDTHEPAQGEGASKRLAEQAAASAFLAREGIVVENRHG